MENSVGSGVGIPFVCIQICLFLSEWAWRSHFTSLSLSVLTYEKGTTRSWLWGCKNASCMFYKHCIVRSYHEALFSYKEDREATTCVSMTDFTASLKKKSMNMVPEDLCSFIWTQPSFQMNPARYQHEYTFYWEVPWCCKPRCMKHTKSSFSSSNYLTKLRLVCSRRAGSVPIGVGSTCYGIYKL